MKNLPKWVKTPNDFKILNRLEQLRKAIIAENISYGELAELQSLVKYIDKDDIELLEWAGVPEKLVTDFLPKNNFGEELDDSYINKL